MLKYNFIYELKILLRSKWIQLLSVLLLLLFGFSGYNGLRKVEKRKSDIAFAKAEVQENKEVMITLLDSVQRGLEVSVSSWTIPSNPMTVGNRYPEVAAMKPQPMALIATGQADMFTHYIKPTAGGAASALNFTEMTSPVQLLFGSFDIAFVIVFLLPLLIIAFSYDVLSSERESGSLRLLASQPIHMQSWVLQKLGLRFFWLSVLVIAAILIVFSIVGINPLTQISEVLGILGMTLAYMLFWFGLAFLVNLWVGTSAKNAVALLGLWVVFVLLAPSVLNQLGSAIYPMPSRSLMLNEMRIVKADAIKKQDEILDNYLRDHPEYAVNDTTQVRTFWHSYMASQNLVKEELAPVVATYEEQLQKQQDWISQFKWISPAVIVQESMNEMAGTSTADYEEYRKQVVTFSEEWRAHFMPFLYNNTPFTKADVANLPTFHYKQPQRASIAPFIVLAIAMGLFGIGFITSSSRKKYTLSN